MPEITYLLPLSKAEANAILNGFAMLHKYGVYGDTETRRLMARIVELTTGSENPVNGPLPANHHGPNDPGSESQPDALSPYTHDEWREIS